MTSRASPELEQEPHRRYVSFYSFRVLVLHNLIILHSQGQNNSLPYPYWPRMFRTVSSALDINNLADLVRSSSVWIPLAELTNMKIAVSCVFYEIELRRWYPDVTCLTKPIEYCGRSIPHVSLVSIFQSS